MTPSQESVYQKIVDDLLVRAAALHYEGKTEIPMDKAEFVAAFLLREIQLAFMPDGKLPPAQYFMGLKVSRLKKRVN